MKLEHMAIWTRDIEVMREFYLKYFDLVSNDKYSNESKGYRSYFLSFDSGARLELMQKTSVEVSTRDYLKEFTGMAHLAISVGSEEKVDSLTARLKNDGFEVVDGPRKTGDGYYESVVFDPEQNRIEITV